MGKALNVLDTVSIVAPCFNEEDNIIPFYDEVRKYLKGWKFEIIFIDDGSTDTTLARIKGLTELDSNVKYVSLSRNFGHQAALRAGLRSATGSAVISMDADLQHPPRLLPEMLENWKAGFQVVYTRRKDKSETGLIKRSSSVLFYKLMRFLSGLTIEAGTADFRLLDRKVVDIINQQIETDFFLRGYISWMGFRQFAIPYTPDRRRNGKSKYTYRKMFKLATQGITQFSVKPLRLSIIIGFMFSLLGGLYGVFALVSYFTASNEASGWTSLIVVVLTTSGIQLMLLGIVGEYVGKTFLQAKGRPDYLVSETNAVGTVS